MMEMPAESTWVGSAGLLYDRKRPEILRFQVFHMVEISGIEPLTS